MWELNQEALGQLRNLKMADGSGSLLNRLIDVYNTESPHLLQQLVCAGNSANLKDVAAYAHNLKSSSAQLGALGLSETCKAIEMVGNGAIESEPLPALIEQAKSQLEAVMRQLEDEKI